MNTQKLKADFDLFLLVIIVGVLIFAGTTNCQNFVEKSKTTAHLELHSDQEEYEDSIGFTTIKVTSKDESNIYWSKATKREIKLSSFGYDKETHFPDKKVEGCFIAVYCKKHLMLYMLVQAKCGGTQ